jgi:hypothetical protein
MIIDDQAFLRSYAAATRPPPFPPLSRQQVVSLSQSSFCVVTCRSYWRGGGGGGGGVELNQTPPRKPGPLLIIEYTLDRSLRSVRQTYGFMYRYPTFSSQFFALHIFK